MFCLTMRWCLFCSLSSTFCCFFHLLLCLRWSIFLDLLGLFHGPSHLAGWCGCCGRMILDCVVVILRRCRNGLWVVVLHSSPTIYSSCEEWSEGDLLAVLARCCAPCCNGGGRRGSRDCNGRCGDGGCCVGCSGCRNPRRLSNRCCDPIFSPASSFLVCLSIFCLTLFHWRWGSIHGFWDPPKSFFSLCFCFCSFVD